MRNNVEDRKENACLIGGCGSDPEETQSPGGTFVQLSPHSARWREMSLIMSEPSPEGSYAFTVKMATRVDKAILLFILVFWYAAVAFMFYHALRGTESADANVLLGCASFFGTGGLLWACAYAALLGQTVIVLEADRMRRHGGPFWRSRFKSIDRAEIARIELYATPMRDDSLLMYGLRAKLHRGKKTLFDLTRLNRGGIAPEEWLWLGERVAQWAAVPIFCDKSVPDAVRESKR